MRSFQSQTTTMPVWCLTQHQGSKMSLRVHSPSPPTLPDHFHPCRAGFKTLPINFATRQENQGLPPSPPQGNHDFSAIHLYKSDLPSSPRTESSIQHQSWSCFIRASLPAPHICSNRARRGCTVQINLPVHRAESSQECVTALWGTGCAGAAGVSLGTLGSQVQPYSRCPTSF